MGCVKVHNAVNMSGEAKKGVENVEAKVKKSQDDINGMTNN